MSRAIRRPLDESPLLSAFAEARKAAARYSVTSAPRSLLLEEALAYRIACRWYDYKTSSPIDLAASWLTDSEYIEVMFRRYSEGRCRLL